MTAGFGEAAGSDHGLGGAARRRTPLQPGPVCFLRVYEPLAAFEGAELAHWQGYAASGAAPSLSVGAARERAAALRALVGRSGAWTGLPELAEEAFVRIEDGVTLICPWGTRVRAWTALREVRRGLPEPLTDALTSARGAALAEKGLQELARGRQRRREDPTVLRTAITSHPWSVPLAWFALVEDGERAVSLGGSSGQSERSLTYRTAMPRARRRTARALAALRRTTEGSGLLPGLLPGLPDLGRWLEEFHPRSLVELDYGGLVHLMDDEVLQADRSAAELAEALTALSGDRIIEAFAAYNKVRHRMKTLQAVEAAS